MNIPSHVPPELVFDFDFHKDFRPETDPIAFYENLSRKFPGGIFYTPRNGGHWVVTSYERFCNVARNPALFSSNVRGIPPDEAIPVFPPISYDPPDHAKYRLPLIAYFSPKKVQSIASNVRQLTHELIDQIESDGGCEFVRAIAEPLPLTIFMTMMGLPLDRMEEFRNWAVTFLTNNDPAVRPGIQASILAFMEDAIAARKIQPRDDIISDLIRVEIEGRPISHEEVIGYCMLLFLAGLDTVVTALSWGVRHLALYPELQQHIRRDPAITRAVVEESLRRYSFVSPTRIVTEDCDFDGVALRRDDVVVMSSSAANLDPAAFEDPLAFKLNRKGPPHVAFNTGPHNCLGAPLARLELATAYQVMCERIPGFQLDASAPTEFDGCGQVSGIRKLHLVW